MSCQSSTVERRWKNVLQEIAWNTLIIGVVVGTLLNALVEKNWVLIYIFSFIYTFFISSWVKMLTTLLAARLENLSARTLMLAHIGITSLSGILGTLMGSGVISFFFSWWDIWTLTLYLIAFNMIVAVTVGVIFTIFERLRSQQEATRLALKEQEIAQQKLAKLKTEAELRALQAQINPHFLFNALNSIASLIPGHPDKAEQMVEQLSDYFRQTLTMSHKMTITLQEELELVRTYLDIEKVRFGDRLRYEIRLEGVSPEVTIPALSVQPLVENSVKYAVSDRREGATITIQCSTAGEELILEVRDDGPGLPEDWQERGHGLRNVQARLAHLYNGAARLEAENQNGACFRLVIPLNSDRKQGAIKKTGEQALAK